MSEVTLTIDGQPVRVPAGTTIWEAARQSGIEIPVLCHSPRLDPVGVCRMCVVDVGQRVLAASCVRECENGMTVRTDSPAIEQHRAMLTRLLLCEAPPPRENDQPLKNCDLESLGHRYGLLAESGAPTFAYPPRRGKPGLTEPASRERKSRSQRLADPAHKGEHNSHDRSSAVIAVDHTACILCDRCIRACNDIQSNEVIGRMGKGASARIAFDLDNPMGNSTCVSCGECASACPTRALVHKTVTLPVLPQTTATPSVCPYCGVGCAVTVHTQGPTIVRVEGRESPVNDRRLCVKGRYGWDYALHPQRLTKPLIRRLEHYPKGPLSRAVQSDTRRKPGGLVDYAEVLPAFREASWDEALDLVARRLTGIRDTHGKNSLAGFGSAKCSNEEAYLFQKLVRAVFGTNNVDHCTRLCHASSVAALMETIGSGAVTNIFGDVERADVALVTGSNTTHNHPVAATFIKDAAKHGTKLIVVDVRRPDIADFAEHDVQIRPGTDVAFYNGLMHEMIARGWVDEAFIRDRTEGFEDLRELVLRDYAPEQAAAICGVPPDQIRAVARTIGLSKSMIVFWGMGISQHTTGTDNARCLISLCLMTGNVGRPGTGLHPLRGQNNVQGASDAGLIPLAYPDYQLVTQPHVRQKYERAWGVPLDPERGLTVVEITAGALKGTVKGMYILGENPFLSDPNINKVRKALANLDFLVVQDIFLTETAEFADVVLPASAYWEKTGTFTNTDRRVQVGRKVLDCPGEAREDWRILCDLSRRMGYPMDYASPAEVFEEFASLTTSYAGLTHENLGTTGKLWPCADPEHADGEQILFGDRFPTLSGRGKFVACQWRPPAETIDREYPFVLNTGRVLEHWHTGTMTRRSQALNAIEPDAFAALNPDDLAELGVGSGEGITVSSRRGSITLACRSDDTVDRGQVFIPFHFREAAANVLTTDALDPFGKIPEFKYCAVRVAKAEAPCVVKAGDPRK